MKKTKIFLLIILLIGCFFVLNVGESYAYDPDCDYCMEGNHSKCPNKRYVKEKGNTSKHMVYCGCGGSIPPYTLSQEHVWKECNEIYTKNVHCEDPVCKLCKFHWGTCNGGHTYIDCPEPHCSGQVCSVSGCGVHKDGNACGGGHNSNTCDHCKQVYCNKTTKTVCGHECGHNSDGKCTDPHCGNVTWCTYCQTHTHVGCNTSGKCPEPHCSAAVCSVCGKNHQGACGGGHKYEWKASSNEETQNHTQKCTVTSNCTATNGSHTAVWGAADSSHKSKCVNCSLTYTHTPVWSTEKRNTTEAHPCIWHGGCSATHSPSWGAYYKVNGGADGDSDDGAHTRDCTICGIQENYHYYTDETWVWTDASKHTRACKVCGLRQSAAHKFLRYAKKDEDNENHNELYKHWKLCISCDATRKEVDEIHLDNGAGECIKCGQILWKAICDGQNITKDILDEESSAKRPAKKHEQIQIIQVVDNAGTGKIQYIQSVRGEEEIVAVNNVITITKNGEYEFTTADGGTAKFIIANISADIVIDKIITPVTTTTGGVTILIRSNKSEEKYNKKIYIKEGEDEVTNSELANGDNPYERQKTVYHNGIYYFNAKDTAGNKKTIIVEIDNIIKGQTTVTISNDVFINGYVFTEILVNPNKEWKLGSDMSSIIEITANRVSDSMSEKLNNNGIKAIKVMDMHRNEVISQNGKYLPGTYYIQVAVGGSVFNKAGTYILDLEQVKLPTTDGSTLILDGKNRIIVEVQNLHDLT